ncbi:MAG: phospholipase D family protein [Lachnospiraceae bacterium]|nr:phospholipase D family protein [Lachnospiraceae bacterium]
MKRGLCRAGGLLLFLLLYLIVGAIVPFWTYQEVSPETKQQVKERLDEEELLRAQEEDGSFCDRVMLLESNESAWEERIRLLNQAQKRIILSTFDMREGESTRDLLAMLLVKAQEGVSVQILVDGISGVVRMDGNPLFYALSSHPQVEIRLYNRLNLLKPWKTQGRMHDKYLIVDDLAYILGGRNSFDYFIGSYPTNSRSYDREVLVYSGDSRKAGAAPSSLLELETYFTGVWNQKECTVFHGEPELAEKKQVIGERQKLAERYEKLKRENPQLFETPDYQACTYETRGISLISNPTGIYGKEPRVFYELTERMKRAREQVIIHTPYAVCNDAMLEALSQVALEVPKVTIMLNAVENGDNFMASSDYVYHRKDLLGTGISLLEYDGGTSYHGKSMVLDGRTVVVGSYNLDLRSSYVDTELMLVIDSQELAGELLAYMEGYHQDCRQVMAEGESVLPNGRTPQKAPLWKRGAWRVVGLIMQPFRYLV